MTLLSKHFHFWLFLAFSCWMLCLSHTPTWASPVHRFIVYDLANTNTEDLKLEVVKPHPQKTLDYALTQSGIGQGTYVYPKSSSQLNYILNDVEASRLAKSPILLLYGLNTPSTDTLNFIDTLIQRQWKVVLVPHPLMSSYTKSAWQADFQVLTNRYKNAMNEQVGFQESDVMDTALSGSLTTLNPFPIRRLAKGCDLYLLPNTFMICESAVKPLNFVLLPPKPPVVKAPTPAPVKDKRTPSTKASSSPSSSPSTSSFPVSQYKPSYDVLKVFYDLAQQWQSPTIQGWIENRYTPFEEEAQNIEQEFISLRTDIWQRMQAFELLGKSIDKAKFSSQMQDVQTRMDALSPLRQSYEFRQYREKSKVLIENAMALKQNLLFPNLPNQIHGVWFDRGSIVRLGSAERLKERLVALKQSGMTDIFLETINAGYPIYPNSAVQATQNPLIRGWDPLEVAVKEGHRLGLRIHAWVWCFAVGNKRHNTLLGVSEETVGPVLSLPFLQQSTLLMNDGSLVPNGQHEFWLSPASDEAQDFLIQWYTEIVNRYQVDGLQLDYIRYPFQSKTQRAGYDSASLYNFNQATGLNVNQVSATRYDQWKTDNISRFVLKVNKALKTQNPKLVISAAVFSLPRPDRLAAIQQDWETWAERGWIDWLIPMAYTENTTAFNQQIDRMKASLNHTKVVLISGIGLHKLDGVERIERSEQLHKNGVLGWTWFANAHLDASTLNQLKLTTQKDPIGGLYQVSLGQAMTLYSGLLKQILSPPLTQEADLLSRWNELATYIEARNGKGYSRTFMQENWRPLMAETQQVLQQRFTHVPALKLWLNGELERLDTQWRSQMWLNS